MLIDTCVGFEGAPLNSQIKKDVMAHVGVSERDFLWCIDPIAEQFGHQMVILRHSDTKIPGRPVVVPQNGEERNFVLRATPQRKHRGKRANILDNAERILWLREKGQRHGFQVVDLTKVLHTHRVDRKAHVEGGPIVEFGHNDVVFEGRLRVTDREQFAAALKLGIGSTKAYGFGLMQIL